MSVAEIAQLLDDLCSDEEYQIDGADIVIVPPDTHYLTDEGNDDETDAPIANDVPGLLDLHIATTIRTFLLQPSFNFNHYLQMFRYLQLIIKTPNKKRRL